MKVSGKTTLKASLVGTTVGTGAWLIGAGDVMWPAHPQAALFLLTIIATVVFMRILAEEDAENTDPAGHFRNSGVSDTPPGVSDTERSKTTPIT